MTRKVRRANVAGLYAKANHYIRRSLIRWLDRVQGGRFLQK